MDTVFLLWSCGFATALGFIFARQVPALARKWWYGVCGCMALLTAADALLTSQVISILAVLLIIGFLQTYLLLRGFLALKKDSFGTVAIILGSASLPLMVCLATLFFAEQRQQTILILAAAQHLFPVVTCCAVGVYVLKSNRTEGWEHWAVYVPLMISAVGFLFAVSEWFVAFHVVSMAKLLTWYSTTSQLFGFALGIFALSMQESRQEQARLQGRVQQFETILEGTEFGICELDNDGLITYVNNSAAQVLGAGGETLAGKCIHDLLCPEEGSPQALLILRPTVPIIHAKGRVTRSEGPPIAVEWSSFPIMQDEEARGSVLTLRDVNNKTLAEKFEQRRSEIIETVARNKPPDKILEALAAAVEERLPEYCCAVLVCEGDYFRVVSAPQLSEEHRLAMGSIKASRFVQSSPNTGTDQLISWEDSLRRLAHQQEFAKTWTEPIISSANEVVGLLVLHHRSATRLNADDKQLLNEAAGIAALAVEHYRSYERLLHQGYHDALTGLPNRVLLADRLKLALARARRTSGPVALLCIDLDRFKYVNDTFGHEVGDIFLQQISIRFSSRIRSADTLARTGGDEFTAIISDFADPKDAERVAEGLLDSLRDPFQIEGHTIYGGASIGIAVYPKDGKDADTLQRNADRAMYRAKNHSGRSFQLYSGQEVDQNDDSLDIEVQLHHAIERGNFSLYFQPQFTCDQRLVGFEALLRFRHPKLGLIPPTRFIPLAEESGLILPIGEWVLHEACRQIADWRSKGMTPVRVAVNVSPLQFAQADFAEGVARALHAYDIDPNLLELEITEGLVMSNVGDSASQMAEVAKLGVRLAIDDFGTGYSSLSYLHQLPVNVLKIDRSFIDKMLDPSGTCSIVEAIISLAHGLGLHTVAEGVEHDRQLAILRARGCDLIQGYLFARPLPAIDASKLLWQSNQDLRKADPMADTRVAEFPSVAIENEAIPGDHVRFVSPRRSPARGRGRRS